jgi:hypothetical protein
MKKIAFILMSVVVMSCSSSSDDNSATSSTSINPPNWIIGTWKQDAPQGISFKFTSNDLITITNGAQLSQKNSIQSFISAGGQITTTNTSTDLTYSLTTDYNNGQATVYSFTKTSDNIIVWDSASSVDLVKQ